MKFRIDKGTGYMYCYNPAHYTANNAGKVLEHVYVMSESIGRKLDKGECVHHVDRDRTNNRLSNLRLMTISEHSLLHSIEDSGYRIVSSYCNNCGAIFDHPESDDRVYCSKRCSEEKKGALFN